MTESVRLDELTWRDVEGYLDERDSPTVLVPIGSIEQHGPHLPLGVDTYQAEELAVAIAERADVLVAPAIPYGDADHHLGFPGTVSLSTETVVSVLSDVYDSLAGHGFVNIVTLNGHRVANLPAIETAMKRANARYEDLCFATIDPLRIGKETHRELRDGDPEDGMHGGEFETSFMLYRHPDLVREGEFVKESSEGFSQFQTNDLVTGDDVVLTPSTPHSPAEGDLGHVGDPTHASAEKGKELYEQLVESAATFLDELRSHRAGE